MATKNPIPQPIRNLNHPNMNKVFVAKVKDFLKHMEALGKPMAAHETFRTQERQEYLLGTGKSKVRRSNHQDGLACDLHFVNAPHFPTDAEPWRFAAVEAKKFGIDCGGLLWNGWDWNHFQDDGSPHRELTVLPEWQQRAVDWAKSNKVSNGERPNDPITRVEVMEMLRKFALNFAPRWFKR